MRAPEFWQRDGGTAQLLAPLGCAYSRMGRLRRRRARPEKSSAPVICVGNLVAGGAGKTPVVMSLADILTARGASPHLLSRGYGGNLKGPVRVDPDRHSAAQIGDEALLLARHAPTWIARDRAAGARAATAGGADIVVMDDGFQNPTLAKDLSLIVIDGGYGFGNRRVMPAGPLRETLDDGCARADAAVLIGDDETGVADRLAGRLPILQARLAPGETAQSLAGRDVVAFAGIGRPEKFFRTLTEMGCRLVGAHGLPDHHRFQAHEVGAIIEEAAAAGAIPVTTEKDAVRLPPEARALVQIVEVALVWGDPDLLDEFLDRLPVTHRRESATNE